MARMAFEKMTVRELMEAQAEIESLIGKKKVDELSALKARMAQLAAESGFSVEELFNGKANSGKKTGSVAPKYRHPDNAGIVWSGRGRQPLWFVDALKKGIKPEKLLIR